MVAVWVVSVTDLLQELGYNRRLRFDVGVGWCGSVVVGGVVVGVVVVSASIED